MPAGLDTFMSMGVKDGGVLVSTESPALVLVPSSGELRAGTTSTVGVLDCDVTVSTIGKANKPLRMIS